MLSEFTVEVKSSRPLVSGHVDNFIYKSNDDMSLHITYMSIYIYRERQLLIHYSDT